MTTLNITIRHPVFNFARWVAKQITNNKKNIDIKIFIVGPAGSGKSMTGLTLALLLDKYVAYFVYGKDEYMKHIGEFFSFDPNHIAIINTQDLIHVMTTMLCKHSIKVIDDCGAAEGFTSRRSMSTANIDIASIYGTNRVHNGVTIYCVQDTTFTDVRMRKLANVVIDLTNYVEVGNDKIGVVRMAQLRKIRMDKKAKSGINECRFMTYENGQWVTQESIACFMPPAEFKDKYDKMRNLKEAENSKAINEKYSLIIKQEETENEKPRCPYCNSTQLYYSEKKNVTKCKGCGRLV
jgi:hypothetical protein